MSTLSPYQHYQQNAVLGTAPEQLTLMLYNGAAKFIRLAIQSIEEKDIPGAHNSIVRAQDIISYLILTLKEEYEISTSLSALYRYIIQRLIDANQHKDTAILKEVLELTEELRDAWLQAMQANRESNEKAVS